MPLRPRTPAMPAVPRRGAFGASVRTGHLLHLSIFGISLVRPSGGNRGETAWFRPRCVKFADNGSPAILMILVRRPAPQCHFRGKLNDSGPQIGGFHRDRGRTDNWHDFSDGNWHGLRVYDRCMTHTSFSYNIMLLSERSTRAGRGSHPRPIRSGGQARACAGAGRRRPTRRLPTSAVMQVEGSGVPVVKPGPTPKWASSRKLPIVVLPPAALIET